MTSELWQRIENLFHSARGLKGAERIAYLDQACQGDEELRRQIDLLLAQDSPDEEMAGRLLDRPAAELFVTVTVAPFAAGSQLGPYKIEGTLGAGGMGEVFRAVDTRLGRPVAIKVSREQFSERFEREAKAISSLNHPNICTLYDVGPNYLVLELVEGETLAARLKKGKLSIEQTIAYGEKIAEALAEAHAKGIVHRDLKPANIMVTKSGVKVLDFGLAKLQADRTITGAHAVMGTPAYMAPEQLEGREAGARTDIYGLGLVLFEMVTGRLAAPGESVTGVPPQVAHVIDRCLAKDPDDRWQAAGDVGKELQWAGRTIAAAAPTTATSRWRQTAIGSSAAVLLLVLVAGELFFFRSEPGAPGVVARFEIAPPLTNAFDAGTSDDFAVSPDGREIALLNGTPPQLWVRALDSAEAHPLAGTEFGVGVPFWSPDSRYIVFATTGGLKMIEATGGPVQGLSDTLGGLQGGFWTQEGKIVFALDSLTGLRQVRGTRGAASAVTALADGESRHLFPTLLPDGRHFLLLRVTGNPITGAIYLSSLDAKPGEAMTKLLSDNSSVAYVPGGPPRNKRGYLLFVRGGTLMAQPFDAQRLELSGSPVSVAEHVSPRGFSASPNGVLVYRTIAPAPRQQFTWFDRQGKPRGTVGELLSLESLNSAPQLSPDEKRMAFARTDPQSRNADIWLYEFEHGVTTRFTFDPGTDQTPVWSPDGRSIAFSAQRSGAWGLYRKASNLAGGEELLCRFDDERVPQPTSWSRDGRFLMFHTAGSVEWVLEVGAGASGKRKPFLLPVGSTGVGGRFSPDGRYFSYISRESGTQEIYVQSFDFESSTGPRAGGKWMVSKGGGLSAHWRADGRELFYMAPNGDIMAVDVSTTPTFHAGSPRRLFNPHAASRFWDSTGDGQRFLHPVALTENAPAPYTVVVNWLGLLRK